MNNEKKEIGERFDMQQTTPDFFVTCLREALKHSQNTELASNVENSIVHRSNKEVDHEGPHQVSR